MIEIASPRLSMRQITETDWPLFLRLHQEEEVIRYAFDQPELMIFANDLNRDCLCGNGEADIGYVLSSEIVKTISQ